MEGGVARGSLCNLDQEKEARLDLADGEGRRSMCGARARAGALLGMATEMETERSEGGR